MNTLVSWLKSMPLSVWTVWLLVVALWLVHRLAARAVLTVITRRQRARHPVRQTMLVHALDRPLGLLLSAAATSFALSLTPALGAFDITLKRGVNTLVVVAFFIILHHVLNVIDALSAQGHTPIPHLTQNARHYLLITLRVVIIVIGGLTAVSIWVPNIAGVVAGLGLGGLAVALAAQDTLANVIGSLAIMFDHPFQLGDLIKIDGYEGVVQRIGLRSSQIQTIDHAVITIPNKTLAAQAITNLSARDRRRVETFVPLSYTTDPVALTAFLDALRTYLANDPDIDCRDEPSVHLDTFGERALTVRIVYVTDKDYVTMRRVQSRIHESIVRLAATHGVIWPYSHTITHDDADDGA